MTDSLTTVAMHHGRTATMVPSGTKTSLTAFKCAERLWHDMPSSNERAGELRLACRCSVYVYDITTFTGEGNVRY